MYILIYMEFTEMLDDIYNQLQTVKSEHIILPVPILIKDTTSIIWKNIKDFLKLTRTDPQHLFDFIKMTLGSTIKITWKSESITDGLIIHKRQIKENDIIDIMRKYSTDYILCVTCKKNTTEMIKDDKIKKWKIKCLCGSEYTAIEIK